ncbi:hypothetical protein ACN47E_004627 [Coniothyrium glycines]
MITDYWREECTVKDWQSGQCLTVCLTNSVDKNVQMTPCDGTANSTMWCCGNTKDCCAAGIGMETLAAQFIGIVASSSSTTVSLTTTSITSATSASLATTTMTSATPAPNNVSPEGNEPGSISGGEIAGIVVGVVAGLALLAALIFLLARRRRSASRSKLGLVEAYPPVWDSKTYHAYEADSGQPAVEVPAMGVKRHAQRAPVYEL